MTITMEAIDQRLNVLAEIVTDMATVQKQEMTTKAAATSQTGQNLHGTAGLWGVYGAESEVVSTHLTPQGIGTVIPAFPSNSEIPRFGFLTGISDDIGAEPTAVCADAPTGYIKGGFLTAQFGRVFRDTETIEIGETLRQINRGEMTDLQLFGSILSEGAGVMYPNLTPDGVLNTVTKAQMVVAATLMERKLARMIWNGTPTANLEPAYREFPGLDAQITTGQVDAVSNTALPSADSLVLSAAYGVLGEGYDVVGQVQEAEYHIDMLARGTVGSVDGILVMRPQVWKHLTEVWPCQYNTNDCADEVGGNSRVFLDGRQNINERDEMRRNLRLPINGKDYRVVLDDGITENTSVQDGNLDPGQYASSIYFIPLTIGGNLPVTYWQYLDFKMGDKETALLNSMQSFWTDEGRFLWAYDGVYSCFKLKMRTEPRIILRTPQLAWRIDNVVIAPQIHNREFDPNHAHWVNGGVSQRVVPTNYAVWS